MAGLWKMYFFPPAQLAPRVVNSLTIAGASNTLRANTSLETSPPLH
jgi:hypothetical protein